MLVLPAEYCSPSPRIAIMSDSNRRDILNADDGWLTQSKIALLIIGKEIKNSRQSPASANEGEQKVER